MFYLIANWKANLGYREISDWLTSFKGIVSGYNLPDSLEIIIAPPFPFIPFVKEFLRNNLPSIKVASQDISAFEKGPYTGEVPVELIKEFISYAIIGHQERRIYLRETPLLFSKKLSQLQQAGIKAIYCTSEEGDNLASQANLIAYEPLSSIGTGHNAPLSKVLNFKKSLNITLGKSFLYGGSVDENNILEYLSSSEIKGFLLGNVSLDPQRFWRVIEKIIKKKSKNLSLKL